MEYTPTSNLFIGHIVDVRGKQLTSLVLKGTSQTTRRQYFYTICDTRWFYIGSAFH